MNKKTECLKDCTTCIYYDVVLGIKAVCTLWLVGFDVRGYEPCDEYKERGENGRTKENAD